MGLPPQRQAPPPPSGPAAYAQSLLSRFNLPAATAAPTASASNDWYSALSSTLGSITSGGKSREAQQEELSASGTLLQRHLADMSSTQKAEYISAQREVLDHLRSTLMREEQTMGRDDRDRDRDTDDLAYGGPLKKDPSDNSFDVVDDEDLGNRASRRTSGRWGGWLGNDQDSSGSSNADYAARSTGYDRY